MVSEPEPSHNPSVILYNTNNDQKIDLRRSFNIKYDPIARRLRCSGHIINLSVKSFLFVTDNETLEATEGKDVTDRWLKSIL